MVMFFVGFKAPSFLHIFAIRKMKSRTPEPELLKGFLTPLSFKLCVNS